MCAELIPSGDVLGLPASHWLALTECCTFAFAGLSAEPYVSSVVRLGEQEGGILLIASDGECAWGLRRTEVLCRQRCNVVRPRQQSQLAVSPMPVLPALPADSEPLLALWVEQGCGTWRTRRRWLRPSARPTGVPAAAVIPHG